MWLSGSLINFHLLFIHYKTIVVHTSSHSSIYPSVHVFTIIFLSCIHLDIHSSVIHLSSWLSSHPFIQPGNVYLRNTHICKFISDGIFHLQDVITSIMLVLGGEGGVGDWKLLQNSCIRSAAI